MIFNNNALFPCNIMTTCTSLLKKQGLARAHDYLDVQHAARYRASFLFMLSRCNLHAPRQVPSAHVQHAARYRASAQTRYIINGLHTRPPTIGGMMPSTCTSGCSLVYRSVCALRAHGPFVRHMMTPNAAYPIKTMPAVWTSAQSAQIAGNTHRF